MMIGLGLNITKLTQSSLKFGLIHNARRDHYLGILLLKSNDLSYTITREQT